MRSIINSVLALRQILAIIRVSPQLAKWIAADWRLKWRYQSYSPPPDDPLDWPLWEQSLADDELFGHEYKRLQKERRQIDSRILAMQ